MSYPNPEWRAAFPVVANSVYLNHAAVSPIAQAVRQAMVALLDDVHHHGAWNWMQWNEMMENARRRAATLIGAQPREIGFLKNTSEGLATVAMGIDWRPGDRVVCIASEFPANLYPWLALRQQGVVVELLQEGPEGIDLEELRRRCRGARLLAVSFVQFFSGFRLDPAAVGAICLETGTLLVMDGIQGLGAFPINVKAAGVHVLAADAHKWLTGPEGIAIFFVDEAVLEQIRPREVGWMSVENFNDRETVRRQFDPSADWPWRPGTARFECGTANTVGLAGLGAALEMLTGIGLETIAASVLERRDQLALGLQQRGARLLGAQAAERNPNSRSGIVTFQMPGQESQALHSKLAARKICCALRGGAVEGWWVRCSPHFYNDAGDIEAVLQALEG